MLDQDTFRNIVQKVEQGIQDSYEVPNIVVRDMPSPKVTVRTSTYQHEPFIRQCIESVLMQRTTFPVEYVIGEDFSTDGTREIVMEYAAKYPGRIRVFTADRNVGMKANGRRCTRALRGEYVALCEGDDYWTDPLKLQKQVDFLESHSDYSMCFHRAIKLQGGVEEVMAIPDEVDLNEVRFADLLATNNFIATASILYRRQLTPPPAWFSNLPFGDLGLHFLNSRKGKIKCLDECMSVYRIHEGGMWSGKSRTAQLEGWLHFISILWKHLSPGERVIARKRRREVLNKIAYQRYPDSYRRMKLYGRYLGMVRYLQGL